MVLPYINMNLPRYTRVPHPEPPSHLSPLTIPLGHPSAPAPNILYPALNLDCDSVLTWYYTFFNAILPNHLLPPSPTESKRLFYTSVSLLLSHIQGYHCHLSKFHIYVLVYCIGVFLSGCIIGSSFIHLIRTESNVPLSPRGPQTPDSNAWWYEVELVQ